MIFKLINNAVLEKDHGKCVKAKRYKSCHYGKKRNYLVSEPNYHTAKFFTGNVLAIKLKKIRNSHE